MERPTYRTGELARLTRVHPNTLRFYEEIGFLGKPARKKNGYRVYTVPHLMQVRLIRLALRTEALQNGIRKQAVAVLRLSASGRLDEAIRQTHIYERMLDAEAERAKAAVRSVEGILHRSVPEGGRPLPRREAAARLGVTVETLRNWERNGLVVSFSDGKGRRIYRADDLARLNVVRTLRAVNYSMAAILRLMTALSTGGEASVSKTLDTPGENEEIVSACDHLLSTLAAARLDAGRMLALLCAMRKISKPSSNTPA